MRLAKKTIQPVSFRCLIWNFFKEQVKIYIFYLLEPLEWTSENDFDTAQLITKRILYASRLWIFRLNVFAAICSFTTLLIGHLALGLIAFLMYKSNAKIQRKIRQYSNNPELEKKVREKMKELRKKEKMHYQRSSKASGHSAISKIARAVRTRNKRNPKLKKEKKKWKLKKKLTKMLWSVRKLNIIFHQKITSI